MLKRKQTINAKTFTEVISKGKSYGSKTFFVKVLKNNEGHARFGIGVSKKTTKSPVKKNYYKRVLRHILKDMISSNIFNCSCDVVIIIQPDAAEKSFEELKKDAEKLLLQVNKSFN
ncbi:MAG: ribonuclease P protein component [Candidatus Spechtbacterales bacterium]